MAFFRMIGVFIECFRLAGVSGFSACAAYYLGLLHLDDPDPESLIFGLGYSDANICLARNNPDRFIGFIQG